MNYTDPQHYEEGIITYEALTEIETILLKKRKTTTFGAECETIVSKMLKLPLSREQKIANIVSLDRVFRSAAVEKGYDVSAIPKLQDIVESSEVGISEEDPETPRSTRPSIEWHVPGEVQESLYTHTTALPNPQNELREILARILRQYPQSHSVVETAEPHYAERVIDPPRRLLYPEREEIEEEEEGLFIPEPLYYERPRQSRRAATPIHRRTRIARPAPPAPIPPPSNEMMKQLLEYLKIKLEKAKRRLDPSDLYEIATKHPKMIPAVMKLISEQYLSKKMDKPRYEMLMKSMPIIGEREYVIKPRPGR